MLRLENAVEKVRTGSARLNLKPNSKKLHIFKNGKIRACLKKKKKERKGLGLC